MGYANIDIAIFVIYFTKLLSSIKSIEFIDTSVCVVRKLY